MTALKYNSVLVPSDFSDQAHDAVETGLAICDCEGPSPDAESRRI